MKNGLFRIALVLGLAAPLEVGAGPLETVAGTASSGTYKVAVLHFANYAGNDYERFVRSLSDMLMTSLGKSEKLTIIERIQIERAMQNFALELSGAVDARTAAEIGKWLGANAVVLGSFTQFGEEFRLDARLIDGRTGALLVAENARGTGDEVMTLVDQLGERLLSRLTEKEAAVQGGTGLLEIRFIITKTEMGERPVYHHICKIYVDGKFAGMGKAVLKAEEWTTLFADELPAGKHAVEIVHGYVRDGKWDGEMPEQPGVFYAAIEPKGEFNIRYSFEVGWFGDRYIYKHPWRGIPR